MLNNACNETNIFRFNSSLNMSRSNMTENILQAVDTNSVGVSTAGVVFKVLQVRLGIHWSTDFFWLRCKWRKWMLNNVHNKTRIFRFNHTLCNYAKISSLFKFCTARFIQCLKFDQLLINECELPTGTSTTSAWGQRGIRVSETNNYKMSARSCL